MSRPRGPFALPLCAALATLACSSPPALAGDGTFGPGYETGMALPVAVVVGDLNGDGRADLAAPASQGSIVAVRLGQPGGGFKAASDVPVGLHPNLAVVADFNTDGKDDLAVAATDDNAIAIRLGKGDGTFTNGSGLSLGAPAFGLVVGDFNADAREDLAIGTRNATTGDKRVLLRLGSGAGFFTTAPDVVVGATTLATGDFNNDTIQDLARGGFGGEASGVLQGTGGGAFAAGADFAFPDTGNPVRSSAVGDFNADGRQDVAAAQSSSDVVSVRLGKGNGSFTPAPDVPVGDNPYAVAVGDLDSDGRDDFAVANGRGTVASVRLGNGDGTF